MKLIKWAILFLLFSVPAEAQQNFNTYVMGLPVQTPASTDFLYLLHNGVSSRTSVANFTTNPISTCGTAGAVAYYPAANNTVSCLPNITGGINTLTLNSSMTLTLPDGTTWNSAGFVAGTTGNYINQKAPSAAPSSICNTGSYASAFSCDLSKLPYAIGSQITGTATLGQPSSGYQFTPNLSVVYTYLSNFSGWNNITSGDTGRTGEAAFYTKADNYGQGDVFAYFGNIFVDGALSGATSFLANPAALSLAVKFSPDSPGSISKVLVTSTLMTMVLMSPGLLSSPILRGPLTRLRSVRLG